MPFSRSDEIEYKIDRALSHFDGPHEESSDTLTKNYMKILEPVFS